MNRQTKLAAASLLPDAGANLKTEDWLTVARETLIREGIDAVKIDRLAKACGVTRGGFYWRFKNREDLLGQLILDWRNTNTAPYLAVLTAPGTPRERFLGLVELWLEERDFRPEYDNAVRNWAVTSPKVARIVQQVDEERIEVLVNLFKDAGYTPDEAFIRARVTYFCQVGYYTMDIKETPERRRDLVDLYYRVFTGFGDDGSIHEVIHLGRPAKTKEALEKLESGRKKASRRG